MKKILKYSFSILFVLICAVSVLAQKGTVMPSAVRIGTDLGFIGVSLFDPDKKAFEINADVDLYKFFITADYGMASWEFSRENFAYDNSGSYFKAGIDYNLIARDPDLNVIYFGLKYAHSSFDENFSYSMTDPFFYDYAEQISKPGMSANWYEANFGMKIRVWKDLYLGWAGRIKFAKKVSANDTSFDTYYIPGYGLADSDSRWGFNYQIFYRIPFREKPPYKPKKVKEKVERDEETRPIDNQQNEFDFN
jgi:hypothetical protein